MLVNVYILAPSSTPWTPDDIVLSLINIIPILLKYFYHKYFLIIHFSIVNVVSIFFKKKIILWRWENNIILLQWALLYVFLLNCM